MARSITFKKEQVPPFLVGMLVMFIISIHFGNKKTQTRSLPMKVACSQSPEFITSRFTEDVLEGKPVAKAKEQTPDSKDSDSSKKGSQGDQTQYPTDTSEVDDDEDNDEVSKDPKPNGQPVTGKDEDNNPLRVPPSTVRDPDIVDTTTPTVEGQSNLNDGQLKVGINRL